MFKQVIAFVGGVGLVAVATVVPVLAQTSDSAQTDVDVASFLEFAISNTSADCNATAGGDCPFGTNDQASETSLDNTSGYASSFSTANTSLQLRTNNVGGAQVTAHGTNGAVDASNCLVSGSVPITDSITDLAGSQAANDSADPVTDEDTGLAFRLLDAGTAADLREADEDTQWGTGDVNGTDALWASFPMTSGNAEVIFDTTTEQTMNVLGIIQYFVGVASSQPAGNYSCTANYTATTL